MCLIRIFDMYGGIIFCLYLKFLDFSVLSSLFCFVTLLVINSSFLCNLFCNSILFLVLCLSLLFGLVR